MKRLLAIFCLVTVFGGGAVFTLSCAFNCQKNFQQSAEGSCHHQETQSSLPSFGKSISQCPLWIAQGDQIAGVQVKSPAFKFFSSFLPWSFLSRTYDQISPKLAIKFFMDPVGSPVPVYLRISILRI